jgi:hypothetical protein
MLIATSIPKHSSVTKGLATFAIEVATSCLGHLHKHSLVIALITTIIAIIVAKLELS